MISREICEAVAKQHNCTLGPRADQIIERVNKRDGYCPCRIGNIVCPCKFLEDDLETRGQCVCGLFVKGGGDVETPGADATTPGQS